MNNSKLQIVDSRLGPTLARNIETTFRNFVESFESKDYKSRLNIYLASMHGEPLSLLVPDLQGYADKLYLDSHPDGYIRNHISTLRMIYKALIKDRDYFYTIISPACNPYHSNGPLEQKAFVDELIIRITNALDVRIKISVTQDKADSELGVRLEAHELLRFLVLPGKYQATNYLRYLRDKAILNLMASTGIREKELVSLTIDDLFQTYGGYPALRVKQGKGRKQRMIPYGENNPLELLEDWLENSGIDDLEAQKNAYVFCPITKGGTINGDSEQPLSTRTIQRIFKAYSEDYGRKIAPHDLRRTYAYLLWTKGVDLVVIKSNLGHSRLETTLGYIGPINASKRLAPKIF